MALSGSELMTAQEIREATDFLRCHVIDCGTISSLPVRVPASGTNDNINAQQVCIHAELGTPSAQLSDWTVTTYAGYLQISGTLASGGSTTCKLYLVPKERT